MREEQLAVGQRAQYLEVAQRELAGGYGEVVDSAGRLGREGGGEGVDLGANGGDLVQFGGI